MLKTYREYDTDIYVVSQETSKVRLLQSDKPAKLSLFRIEDGGIVKSKTNGNRFYGSHYVLGRHQGDMYNETHSDDMVYNDLVVFDDGTYRAGQFHSWDYQQNVKCGVTPDLILMNEGKDVELISGTVGEGRARLTNKNPQTALFVCEGNKWYQFKCDGREGQKNMGLSGYEVRDFIKSHYPNVKGIFVMDGGGSSELIYKGKIVGGLSDGRERPVYDSIAFVDYEDNNNPEPVVKQSFLTRLSKNGMKNNKYWYDLNYNIYAKDPLFLPNCTCYCAGRSCEIAGRNIKTEIPRTNAQTWYADSKWSKGSVPKVGAIAVWNGGKYGHVAIVEKVEKDAVVFSQSNYTREPSKIDLNYFQVKRYKPVVGKVTPGVGLTFSGYLYNPYVQLLDVERNPGKDQVQVLVDKIRTRKTPNGEVNEGLYIPTGLYNILEMVDKDGYTWARVDQDVWFALNDKDGWTTTYLVTSDDEKVKELEKLLKEANNTIVQLQNEQSKLLLTNQDLNRELEIINSQLAEAKKLAEKISQL